MPEVFDYYDALAHLIPGTLGCLFLLYVCDFFGISLKPPTASPLGGLAIGVAVAYTIGHLLQSIASSLEPNYYRLWGGKPSERLLTENSEKYPEKTRLHLLHTFEVYFACAEPRPTDAKNLRRHCQRLFGSCMALCNRNKLGRVASFNANYAFHRVLLTTFLLCFASSVVTLIITRWFGALAPERVRLLWFLVVASAAATWIEFGRAKKRANYYAWEVIDQAADYIRSHASVKTAKA